MTDDKDTPSLPRTKRGDDIPAEVSGKRDADRERREAAAALLSPAVPPAAAGALGDADPRLDDRSETEQAVERAKGVPD